MPLLHIISLCDHANLWKIAHMRVKNLSIKKEIYQFRVACVPYPNLRQNNAFKEQIDKCLSQIFDEKRQQLWWKHLNTTLPVPLLLSCSTGSGNHLFSMCWLSIASLTNMCVLIFVASKKKKLTSLHRIFEDTSFN